MKNLKLKKNSELYFITIVERGYSRSWTYYSILESSGYNVKFIQFDSSNLIKQFIGLRKKITSNCVLVVMSPSQYLTFLARIFLSKRIILDAGWSLFEGTVISRGIKGKFYFKALKTYLIDFLAARLSKVIFLESEEQKKYFSKLFITSKKKCKVLYTGVDEPAFIINPNLKTPSNPMQWPVVLFRGKFNPEAGMETLADATLILEDKPVFFWVYCPGLPDNIKFSQNTYVNKELISKSDIATIQKYSTLSLGQLANHPRLSRTIPHKAFEAAYLGSPYLTARTKGIQEIFKEDRDIACFEAGSATDLSSRIWELLNNPEKLRHLSFSIKSTYSSQCSQVTLMNQFKEFLGMING